MILYAERGLVGEFEAAVAAVEQRDMRCAGALWQRLGIDREAVVHAGDFDCAVAQPLDWMVRAAMALVHLERLCADREREHLVAEANAEQRLFGREPLADHRHGIFARRRRIAGAVGKEQAIGIMRHDVFKTGGCAYDGYFTPCINKVSQDILFNTIIDCNDLVLLKPLPLAGGVGVGCAR